MLLLPTYSLVAGDQTTMTVTCVDQGNNNAVIPLAGMTASLLYRIGQGAVQTRSMTIVDAPNGKVSYKFAATDLTAGMMQAVVQLRDGAGNIISQLQPYLWEVRPAPLI